MLSNLQMEGLRIRGLRVRPVLAPMRRPLATATGRVLAAPLLLIDLHTDAADTPDLTGHSYLFTVSPDHLAPVAALVQAMGRAIAGLPLAPLVVEQWLHQRYRLLGVHHMVLIAMAGIDMALWDALGQALGQPLSHLLGGRRQAVRAYNSNGLGLQSLRDLAAEAESLQKEGFPAIKLRLGYPTLAEDLAAVQRVREVIGPETGLMVDYNQSLTVAEAIRRGQALDDAADLLWMEEPVRAEDFSGCAQVAQAVRTPIQLGENFMGPQHMAQALRLRCCDLVMPDVQRIGGISAWMRAAALAHAEGIEMSSHLFPEASAALLSVTPTAHWLEYVDWADAVMAEPLHPQNGILQSADIPGLGLRWDEDAVQRYRFEA